PGPSAISGFPGTWILASPSGPRWSKTGPPTCRRGPGSSPTRARPGSLKRRQTKPGRCSRATPSQSELRRAVAPAERAGRCRKAAAGPGGKQEGKLMIQEAIRKAVEGVHLTEDEAAAAMEAIMEGEATPAQIAAFITALRIKGETVDEIAGCAREMRETAAKITPRRTPLVDTCGTGGDGANTFNISTAAAFVAAAAGAAVAKHGNRSVSSRCGSADVLEALGVRIDLTPDAVRECIDQVGIGFLFAPLFHSSMRHAVGPRKEIGIRSVFNVLGPLTNPASAQVQVVGVYDAALTEPLARVLGRLSVREAYVVHGQPRLDEISISGETQVSHLKDGEVHTFRIRPEDAGLKTW